MTEGAEILLAAKAVVVIDWPSKDVPETLARAGYRTIVKSGPDPNQYVSYEIRDSEAVQRPLYDVPAHADLVYAHRPMEELAQIIALAKDLGARCIWLQSGRTEAGEVDPKGCWLPESGVESARRMAHEAGLSFVDHPYIADAVRKLGATNRLDH